MKKIIVSDSCSLILLSKCGLLTRLAELSEIYIPGAVFKEVVNEETLQIYPDALEISQLVESKVIRVGSAGNAALKLPLSLGRGELEAIKLAATLKDSIFATDDNKAIKACRYLKLPFIISPRIAVDLHRLGKIEFSSARSAIEKLRVIGRYSPEIIAEALMELEGNKNVKNSNG
jgi:predicted nucleic acid-binding protein